jgi:cytochrome c oxidase cbb3-type subunit 3
MDGKGMTAVGAPNLTDDVWLYGGDAGTLRETVTNGRAGQMPAFQDKLGEQRVRLLAAYVLKLSGSAQ